MKTLKNISKNLLFDTLLYILFFIVLSFLLFSFNLMFREWVILFSALIILFGLVIGTIQFLLKIKKKSLKRVLITLFIIFLFLSTPILSLLGVFCYKPEHVVEKDERKYVAYVNGFLQTTVYYYDYKNQFAVGNQKRIVEYYGKGGFDPIENKYGYSYNIERTIYYDENGQIISITE